MTLHAPSSPPPGRVEIARRALPIVVANCAAPLLGLADTAVIGHAGSVAELGAIALGALVFSFVYWTFGFLRMGTTGLSAQATGAGDEPEARAVVGRALTLALGLGVVIALLGGVIGALSLALLDASPEVEGITRRYIELRILGAPAALAGFVVSGALIGLGESGKLLRVSLALNGLNIALDVLFAGALGWGAEGVAVGTALAEWIALGYGLLVLGRLLQRRRVEGGDDEPLWPAARIRDRARFFATLRVNADILVRTVALLSGFAWFTNQGARFGEVTLAANHVLLQLISLSAFLLDGFAFVTESLVGAAVGARDVALFDAAVRRATELAAAAALALAVLVFGLGDPFVRALTDLDPVRATAARFLPYAAVYVLLSFPAFQLDGVFIGATRGRQLRNAAILALGLYLGAFYALVDLGNQGLWLSFIAYVVVRALALGAFYPFVRRSLSSS